MQRGCTGLGSAHAARHGSLTVVQFVKSAGVVEAARLPSNVASGGCGLRGWRAAGDEAGLRGDPGAVGRQAQVADASVCDHHRPGAALNGQACVRCDDCGAAIDSDALCGARGRTGKVLTPSRSPARKAGGQVLRRRLSQLQAGSCRQAGRAPVTPPTAAEGTRQGGVLDRNMSSSGQFWFSACRRTSRKLPSANRVELQVHLCGGQMGGAARPRVGTGPCKAHRCWRGTAAASNSARKQGRQGMPHACWLPQ